MKNPIPRNSLTTKLLTATALGGVMFSSSAIAEVGNYYTANKESAKAAIQYRCMDRSGIPATVAYTSRGAIELIRWQNDYFNASSYTPGRRCKEVSSRFQHHSDSDNLRFISTGVINNYKAICISEKTGDCKQNGLLLTLQPEDDSEEVLRSLFSLDARRARGGVLRGSGSRKIKETIDINQFLADSPTVDLPEPEVSSPGSKVIESPFQGL